MPKKYNDNGLTLIETVLVVFVVLLSVGLVTTHRINQHEALTRDATRKENVRLLSTKLEAFYVIKHTFPAQIDELRTSGLLGSIPVDPLTKKYYSYTTLPADCSTANANCGSYAISAKLENKNDKDADSITQIYKISGGLNFTN